MTSTAVTDADLQQIESLLTEEAERLRDQIDQAHGQVRDFREDLAEGDEIDEGMNRMGTEQSESDAQHAFHRLELFTSALSRIADGSYGVCVDCASPIGRDRLLALPAAERCIRCESRRRPEV